MIKLQVTPVFPANVKTNNFITIDRSSGTFTIDVDYTKLTDTPIQGSGTSYIAVYDAVDKIYKLVSIADILSGATFGGSVRVVNEAGDITVGIETRVLVMNRAVDETPSKIILPEGASKVGDIKIVDWKSNSGTFPHDVYPTGAEKFNGIQTVWHINGDGASAKFDPVPSLGYAV